MKKFAFLVLISAILVGCGNNSPQTEVTPTPAPETNNTEVPPAEGNTTPLSEAEIVSLAAEGNTEVATVNRAIERQAEIMSELETETLTVLGTGEFVKIDDDYFGSGEVSLTQQGERYFVSFAPSFNVESGPDLYVYLSQDQTFGPAAKDGANLELMTEVSPLLGIVGDQMYEISATDLEQYGQNVVIWCKEFGILYTYASLN